MGTLVDVVATESDGELGGEEFDDALYDHVCRKIVDEGGPDLADAHAQDRAALREEVTDAKHDLAHLSEAFVVWKGTEVAVTREELDSVLDEYLQRSLDRTAALFERDAMRDEGITRDDVDHVLLVSGSTRLPPVQERVEALLGQKPRFDVEPDTVVARGAALHAAEYRDDYHPLAPGQGGPDALSYNIGIESHAGIFIEILEAGARLPAEVTETYTNPADNAAELRTPLWAEGEDGKPVDEAGRVGDIVLEGLPKRPAGDLRLEVTLMIQHDGSLHAEAIETGTKRSSTRFWISMVTTRGRPPRARCWPSRAGPSISLAPAPGMGTLPTADGVVTTWRGNIGIDMWSVAPLLSRPVG